MIGGSKNEIEFEKCVVMAQQVIGMMMYVDDDVDKPTVVRVLASMTGSKDVLDQQEQQAATVILQKLAEKMN